MALGSRSARSAEEEQRFFHRSVFWARKNPKRKAIDSGAKVSIKRHSFAYLLDPLILSLLCAGEQEARLEAQRVEFDARRTLVRVRTFVARRQLSPSEPPV